MHSSGIKWKNVPKCTQKSHHVDWVRVVRVGSLRSKTEMIWSVGAKCVLKMEMLESGTISNVIETIIILIATNEFSNLSKSHGEAYDSVTQQSAWYTRQHLRQDNNNKNELINIRNVNAKPNRRCVARQNRDESIGVHIIAGNRHDGVRRIGCADTATTS